MKACACLLSFYILLLCIAPGMKAIAGNRTGEKACCEQCERSAEHQAKPLKKQEKNSSAERMCNPFEMCKTCVVTVSSLSSISFDLSAYNLHKIIPATEETPKHLALDFWQPPKLS